MEGPFDSFDLDEEIIHQERLLYSLKELRERRVQAVAPKIVSLALGNWHKNHKPLRFEMTRDKVTRVECSCGVVTPYRVPLNTLLDFECPKAPRKKKGAKRG